MDIVKSTESGVVELSVQAYCIDYFLIFVNLTPLNQAGAPSKGRLSK